MHDFEHRQCKTTMGIPDYLILQFYRLKHHAPCKVQIFLEAHKILKKYPTLFIPH